MRRRLTLRTPLAVLLASVLTISCSEGRGPLEPAGDPSAGLIGDLVDLPGSLLGLDLLEAPDVIPVDSARALIGPAGGTLHVPGGHRITFPAGALAEPVEITARVGGSRTIQVTFAPHGLVFPSDRAPTLEMSYAGAGLLDQLGLVRPVIVYVDEERRILENWLGILHLLDRTVETRIQHFSAYALASN